eukprot:TRINITY_DN4413_c0_g1_i3.p1 TRINITY_DN4413_c0_g1~~TRINITY_DN4413_c0_g1_i3.p1  ORF type:complete len:333 (-),score=58.69 TRINITY_DN4413_c0_g1_i3:178-1176(-)
MLSHRLKRGIKFFILVIQEILWYIRTLPWILRIAKYAYLGDYIRNVQYGEHQKAFLDIHPVEHVDENWSVHNVHRVSPVVVFFYGGAWGSGNKYFYGLLGKILARRGVITVIPNYRIYPTGTVEDMVEDVSHSILWTYQHIERFGGDKNRIFIAGHSAGAHLAAQFLVKNAAFQQHGDTLKKTSYDSRDCRFIAHANIKLAGFIGLSGVYDIASHYLFETNRAVEWISTMKPAMGGPSSFDSHSPLLLYRELPTSPQFFPKKIVLMHGLKDHTVPHSTTEDFYRALKIGGIGVTVHFYEQCQHTQLIFSLMDPSAPLHQRVLSHFMEVIGAQ